MRRSLTAAEIGRRARTRDLLGIEHPGQGGHNKGEDWGLDAACEAFRLLEIDREGQPPKGEVAAAGIAMLVEEGFVVIIDQEEAVWAENAEQVVALHAEAKQITRVLPLAECWAPVHERMET